MSNGINSLNWSSHLPISDNIRSAVLTNTSSMIVAAKLDAFMVGFIFPILYTNINSITMILIVYIIRVRPADARIPRRAAIPRDVPRLLSFDETSSSSSSEDILLTKWKYFFSIYY